MKRVLLVEDDMNLSALYEEMLSSSGFLVYIARNKDEARKVLENEEVSFILLDVMLATKDSGLDLLEELKADEATKNIPVVVLTNIAGDKERKRALDLGAKEYIAKAAKDPKYIAELVKKYTATS